MPKGNPTTYTLEKAISICELIASTNMSMKSICEIVGVPYSTHLQWLIDREDYSLMYARAKEDQADLLSDEIVSIADETKDPAKARVQIDARKWVASKLKPKRYGDRIDVDHTTKGDAIKQTFIIGGKEIEL